MPTNRELILAYLREHPEGADDDELSSLLRIRPRQQVNQICRALESEGLTSRRKDAYRGKAVNQVVAGTTGTAQATAPRTLTAVKGRPVVLSGEAAIRKFAYAGEVELSEDLVKQAVARSLEAEGWEADIRWGRVHGIDIEARRGTDRLVLEAKGEGSRDPMRVNYFLCALGELLQRMDSPDAHYGLALPAHRQFVGLVLRLPAWVRMRLRLCFLLVRPTATGEYEVGLIPNKVDWSTPWRCM